jgi:hypothetical protein
MITIQQEILFDIFDEMQELTRLHYEEIALHKEAIPLDPMWEEYATLERIGRLVIFTARDEGKLIGYGFFFINQHMHYARTKIAINDVLFLHPDYRKGTMAGIRLIRFCEQQLAQMAVDKITWHIKVKHDWGAILDRMGYADEDIVKGKMLRGK